jgi:SAM-dependent methyltransferase
MKRSYWEKIAPSYNEEIFDVLKNDKKGLIKKAIRKFASKNKTIIDIGCAIGKWLPVLSPLFKNVIALDISQKNLDIAGQIHSSLKNIEYVRADMSGKKRNFQPCDAGICINAILTPSAKDRAQFFKSLKSCIKKGGHIIITIPSLESWLLTNIVQKQWKIDARLFPAEKNGREALRKWNNISEGNADIDKVPHKHFLKEELALILKEAGFSAERFEKIEYSWKTEFHRPSKKLKGVNPWDWMVIAKRV